MMKIVLNGEELTVADGISLDRLLRERGYDPQGVAVARNQDFVARRTFAGTTVEPGDDIEVVAPMQGG